MKIKTAAAITTLLTFSTIVQANYTPPLGIPDPNWSGSVNPITATPPARPSNWNSSVANFYYVDPSNSNSTDSSNDNGYPNKPRKTIPRQVPAGSYVETRGTFDDKDIVINYDCTAAQPCWLVGSSTSQPNFTNSMYVSGSSYLIIDNLSFSGGEGGALSIGEGSKNIALRNSIVTNREQSRNNGGSWSNYSGIGISAKSNQTTENIIVYNNTISKLGQYDYVGSEDPDFHGVTTSVYSDDNAIVKDVWILENNCSDVAGDCVQVNAGTTNRWRNVHHIYIGKNIMKPGRQAGAWVKQARDVVISQNTIHGARGAGSGNSGAGIGFQYEKDNIWIIFNEIYDSDYGIRQSSTSQDTLGNEVHIIGNLIYDIHPNPGASYDPKDSWSQGTAIALHRGNLDRFIVDNTIYGVYDGINVVDAGGTDIAGNIIADIGSQDSNRFFTTDLAGDRNLVSLDYNLFYDDARQEYRDGSNRNNNVYSLEELRQQKPTYCTIFCDFANPNFVRASKSPSDRDFHLSSSSPAIGKNARHYSYDRFQQLYGLDIYVDFDGKQRATQSSLGAFEYGGKAQPVSTPTTKTNPTPVAPTTPTLPTGSHSDSSDVDIQITWPTSNSSHNTSQRTFDFGGNTPQNKTLKEITWTCTSGCTDGGQGVINRGASTDKSNWFIRSFRPVSGSNTVLITAIAEDGSTATDQITFNYDSGQATSSTSSASIGSSAGAAIVSNTSPVEININWPTSNSSYDTTQRSFDFGGNTPQNKTLKEITWQCTSGCSGGGPGVINRGASTDKSNWFIRSFRPVSGDNTVLITAIAEDGSTATDQISFNTQ